MDFDFEPEERSSGTSRHQPQKIRRSDEKSAADPVTVDSRDFFQPSQEPPAPPPSAPSHAAPTGHAGRGTRPARTTARTAAKASEHSPIRGLLMLILFLQAVLSAAALVQLYRTKMLPVYYLAVLAALLVLVWLLVYKCQRYKVRGFLTRVLSLVLSAAMAVGCVWAQQGLDALDKVTIGDETITDYEAMAITTEPFVVYLSGVDTRGDLTDNARSDVNILAAVNPLTKRVALVNTPRDYYVDLAGTDSKDKLTHAGLYGVETSMETLGGLYGVPVDHYVRINFAGFIDVVDALGGIDVYSDYTFTSVGSPGYYNPTDFVEGWNHLDGAAALAFARERHAFPTGDIQRGINQMKVIEAMLNKIKSPAILTSYSRLLAAVSDNFVTSLSSNQITALVRMQLSDFAVWDIESYTVTGSSSSSTHCYSAQGQKLYVMMPDEESVAGAQTLLQSVLSGEPAPSADSAASGEASSEAAGETE